RDGMVRAAGLGPRRRRFGRVVEAARSATRDAGPARRAGAAAAVHRRATRGRQDRRPPERNLPTGRRQRELVTQALRVAGRKRARSRGGRLDTARRGGRVVARGVLEAALELLDPLPYRGSDLRDPL